MGSKDLDKHRGRELPSRRGNYSVQRAKVVGDLCEDRVPGERRGEEGSVVETGQEV